MISGVMSHRFSVEPVDHTEQCSVTIFVYNLGRDGNESSCKLDSSLIILCSILLMKLITRRALRPYISRQWLSNQTRCSHHSHWMGCGSRPTEIFLSPWWVPLLNSLAQMTSVLMGCGPPIEFRAWSTPWKLSHSLVSAQNLIALYQTMLMYKRPDPWCMDKTSSPTGVTTKMW